MECLLKNTICYLVLGLKPSPYDCESNTLTIKPCTFSKVIKRERKKPNLCGVRVRILVQIYKESVSLATEAKNNNVSNVRRKQAETARNKNCCWNVLGWSLGIVGPC